MLPLPGELLFTVITLSTLERRRRLRPWHRLRLCFPDWFKLNSDWAAEKSREKLFCPLFCSSLNAQSMLSTNAQSIDLTGQEHTARGAHNHPFWWQRGLGPGSPGSTANKASQRGHTVAGCKQLESSLSPTSFVAKDTWQCSCTWPVLYFRAFYFSDSQFVTTTTPKWTSLQKACTISMLALYQFAFATTSVLQKTW